MAKNDYHVIVYKILEYLYACLKNDIAVDIKNICYDAEAIDIPESYWKEIIINMYEEGYIKGVMLLPLLGSNQPGIQFTDLKITVKGIEYLTENSFMQKAKKGVKTIFEVVGIFI